jgi:hypothetical protein
MMASLYLHSGKTFAPSSQGQEFESCPIAGTERENGEKSLRPYFNRVQPFDESAVIDPDLYRSMHRPV